MNKIEKFVIWILYVVLTAFGIAATSALMLISIQIWRLIILGK